MKVVSPELRTATRLGAIGAGIGAAATLSLVLAIAAGHSGEPNSYYAGLQAQARAAAEGHAVDLSGLDPVTLPSGASVALIKATIRQSIGSANSNSQEAYADTACTAVIASGGELLNQTLKTDLAGGVNPEQSTATGASPAPTPTNPAANYESAYSACEGALVSWAADHSVVIATGVPPNPDPVPTS